MYTSHGLMHASDYREHLKDTDQGSTDIDLDDPPAGLDVGAACPVCGAIIDTHVEVSVDDASGEVFRCWPAGADAWLTLPVEIDGAYYA